MRLVGAPVVVVPVQESVGEGEYTPPVLIAVEPFQPPQMIIFVPVQMAVC